MGNAAKLLDGMRRNPVGDWTIANCMTVARAHGVTWGDAAGSHYTFRNAAGDRLTVPAHRPIKAVYIRAFVTLCTSTDQP